MLSFGFRIFCWYRGFCHRTGSDLLLFSFNDTLGIRRTYSRLKPPASSRGNHLLLEYEVRSARGVKSRMCPPYPQRDRKRRLNGAVCRNHRTKRVVLGRAR